MDMGVDANSLLQHLAMVAHLEWLEWLGKGRCVHARWHGPRQHHFPERNAIQYSMLVIVRARLQFREIVSKSYGRRTTFIPGRWKIYVKKAWAVTPGFQIFSDESEIRIDFPEENWRTSFLKGINSADYKVVIKRVTNKSSSRLWDR